MARGGTDRLDHGAGRAQLLGQHALVLSAGDRLEAVTGTGAGLTADHGDGAGVAAELRPIGDSAGVDGGRSAPGSGRRRGSQR